MDLKNRKVFCIGLSRTGTTSLHLALVACGLSGVHYSSPIAMRWLNGDYSPDTTKGFQTFSDVPVAVYFKQLAETHPDALFIYTRRDPEKWLASVERHYQTTPPPSQYSILRDYVRAAAYGSILFSRSRYLDKFHEHEEHVTSFFRDQPEKLLTLETTELSWGPLETFLGVEAPKNLSFPRLKTPQIGQFATVTEKALPARRAELMKVLAGS